MKSVTIKDFISFFFILLVSCSNDDNSNVDEIALTCRDGILNGDEVTIDCGGSCPGFCPTRSLGILEGELVIVTQLNANTEYRLKGSYVVRDKAELNIPAGTVIKADKDAYIVIAQGGRINVAGQPNNPVIITSSADNPEPGDWGGIVICGKAPINTGITERSETADIFYGGSETNTSSGLLKYLRIEYAGAEIEGRKFDALAFYGVGSITTVTNIQTYKSLGNGFRFIGGAVNSKWLAATDCDENGIAISNDWTGTSSYWHLTNNAKAGLKISSNTDNPITTATNTINNVSIIGASTNGGIDYTNGTGIFNFTDLYFASLDLGININSDAAAANVELGNFDIETIEFDSSNSNFVPTNFSDSNTLFYTEGITAGSGNSGNIPDWALGWVIGIN